MTKLRVVIRKFANMHENNGDDRDHQSFYLLCAAALRGKNYTTNHETIDYNHELNSAIVPA
jgi:hypothetical protein